MYDGESPIRFFDIVVRGIFLHAQDLVVVFSLAFLQFQLGVSDFFLDAWFGRVGFGNGFVFSYGFIPVAGLTERFGLCFACFSVCGVELKGTGAVSDSRFVIFQLLGRGILVITLRNPDQTNGYQPVWKP